MARPNGLGLEHTWRTRSRAEGESRSVANKVGQHENQPGRQRVRGNPAARFGVVGPTPATELVRSECHLICSPRMHSGIETTRLSSGIAP